MADQKLTQLTAITSVSDDDLMYIVDDPAGTPLSRKITVLDFKQSFGLTDFSSNGNWKVFYTDGTGAVTELALGANDTVLRSNGAAAAPTFGSVPGDGDGIYDGSGTVPTTTISTLTDTWQITGGDIGVGGAADANTQFYVSAIGTNTHGVYANTTGISSTKSYANRGRITGVSGATEYYGIFGDTVGLANNTTYGVAGQSDGAAQTTGVGVYGRSVNATSTQYGVWGNITSGEATSKTYASIYGRISLPAAVDMTGSTIYGGRFSVANSAADNHTIYGVHSDIANQSGTGVTAYAGWFAGADVRIESNLGIGGIDPLAALHVNGDTRTDGSYYITSERFMHSRYNSSESPATGGNVLLGAGVSTVLGGTGNEGKQNVIIGRLAGATADTMHQSVAVGTTALFNADKGRHLVAVGNSALNGLDPATDLSSDGTIGIGHQALYQLVDGTYNIGIGSLAGSNITGGSNNIHLGRATGASASGSYSVTLAIGENATVNADRQMVFGASAGAEYYEEAYFGAGIDATTITPTTFAMNLTGITTGQTDVAPDYHWEINGSVGTGTGVGGDIRFQVAPAGTTGTAQNALVEAMRIRGNGNIYANLPTYADDTAAGAGGLVTGDLYVETTSGNRHISSKS